MQQHTKKTYWIIFSIGILLFTYVAVRACILSFTHDESTSFLEFVQKDFSPYKMSGNAANNHLLNTWLMKIMSSVFGDSEFSLRLPNILSYILYAFYSAKIVLRFKNNLFAICAFILLNLNPFALDFFSLARGYGLSLGLMMGSLYFLFRFIDNRQSIYNALISVLFASLCVLANLTMTNYLLALVLIIISLLHVHFSKAKNSRKYSIILKEVLLIVLIPALLFYYTVPLFFKLREAKALFYGGSESFWENTLKSSVVVFIYDMKNYYLVPFLKIFVLITVTASAFLIAYDVVKSKLSFNVQYIAVFALLIFISLSTILQHFIFSTLFLIERTALLFFPLFSLLLVFLIERLSHIKPRLIWISPLIVLLLSVHSARSMNFWYIQQWKEDSGIKEAISFIEKNKNLPVDRETIFMGIDFTCEPCINYYRISKQLDWLNVVRNGPLLPTQDYFLTSDTNRYKPLLENAIVLLRLPSVTLYQNLRQPTLKRKLFDQKADFEAPPIVGVTYSHITDVIGCNSRHSSRTESANMYSDGLSFNFPDSVSHMQILITFKAMVYSPTRHFDAGIVFQLDSLEKAVFWNNVNVHHYVQHPKTWAPVCFTAQLPSPILKGEIFKVYLLNTGLEEVYIDNMELKISGYSF